MAKQLCGLICRHGATELNESNCFRSRLDPKLNKDGIAEAERLAKIISRKYKVYKIVSSPMLRALQTADIVAEQLGMKVKQDRGLMPWNLGFLSGKDRDLYGHLLEFYVSNPKQVIPEGESLDQFEERIQEFFDDELKSKYSEAASGTNVSGYAEDGPYHCKDCIHKPAPDKPYCTHSTVISDPLLKDRLVKISGVKVIRINLEHGCCEYVRPKEDEFPKVRLWVTHTSPIVTLQNLFQGNRDGRPETGDEAVGPGGLAEIWVDGSDYSLTPVLEEKEAAFGE